MSRCIGCISRREVGSGEGSDDDVDQAFTVKLVSRYQNKLQTCVLSEYAANI
jgi:hypothetical protein